MSAEVELCAVGVEYVYPQQGGCVVVVAASQSTSIARTIRSYEGVEDVHEVPLDSDYNQLTVKPMQITLMQLLAMLVTRLNPAHQAALAFFANYPNHAGVVAGVRFTFKTARGMVAYFAESLVELYERNGYSAALRLQENDAFIITILDQEVAQPESPETTAVDGDQDYFIRTLCDLCAQIGVFVAYTLVCPATESPVTDVLQQIQSPLE